MNSHIANPKALGFGVLAIALWMFFLAHVGLIHPIGVNSSILHMAMTMAALGLLIAGIMAFLRHESWLAFFFLLWAGLAWGLAYGMGYHGSVGSSDIHFTAWFAIALTLVNLYLWFATVKSRKLGSALSLMVLLLWLSLLLMSLQDFLGVWVLGRISGALGLASALVAFYVSGGTVAHDCCPDMNLPGIPRNDSTS